MITINLAICYKKMVNASIFDFVTTNHLIILNEQKESPFRHY